MSTQTELRQYTTEVPDEPVTTAEPWPDPPDDAVYCGAAGEIVRQIAPETEADPVAILSQMLVCVGNMVGRDPYFTVGTERHYMNENLLLVGSTSKARKGVALSVAKGILEGVDPKWGERVTSGLSSGEGLIWAVRNAIPGQKPADRGVPDKRLMVVESEFGSVLKVLERTGNTLSPLIRQAWDGLEVLQSLTKNSIAKSTRPHISIIGHITTPELRRALSSTESANGFANRFVMLCVRRSRLLPEGGDLTEALAEIRSLVEELLGITKGAGPITRTPEATALWIEAYPELSAGRPGLLGALTARAEAHVMRFACIYALLDGLKQVWPQHLKAALALWEYSMRSVRHIFGNRLGSKTADTIFESLKSRPAGMTRTEVSKLFQGNTKSDEIQAALNSLLDLGLAKYRTETTNGRPVERWYALSV